MRLGIVSADPCTADVLSRAVSRMPDHRVAWVASTEAELAEWCRPGTSDLVLLDVRSAGLNGDKAAETVMASAPCPIIVVTLDGRADPARVFEAVTRGALDVVDVPISAAPAEVAVLLLAKLSTLSRLIVGPHERGLPESRPGRLVGAPYRQLIAIGASAGGPAAIATILSGLGRHPPGAVVVVQHIDGKFTDGMADWLGRRTGLPVRVAGEGERVETGSVLLAGGGSHLVFKDSEHLGYMARDQDDLYRPSIDVFFQSVGRVWRGVTVGVLLTGMGRDGACGLKELRDRGHHTIVQDEASSVVYGMPKAAVALDAAAESLGVERIAPRLMELLASGATRPPSDSVEGRGSNVKGEKQRGTV